MLADRQIHAAVYLAFLVVLVGFTDLRPILNDNESVRLIPGVMLWDPSEFAGDWSFQHVDPSSMPFNWLVAALLHVFSPIVLALFGRVALFASLLYLVWRIAIRLGTGTDALLAGLCAWFLLGQTTLAGEWIVSGFEPKVFSYAFLLAALLAHLEHRSAAGAVFLALACIAHPFVGLWGGGSLVAALAATRQRDAFLLSALVFAGLAFLAGALLFISGPSDPDDLGLYVHFRNPHHLDPSAFGTPRQIFLALIALGIVITFRAFARPWTLLDRWLLFVNLSFAAGLAAWALDFTPLLATYPFRIAPMANLAAACVLVAIWALNWNRADPRIRGAILLAVSLFCVVRTANIVPGFAADWGRFFARSDFAHRPVVSWIRANAGKEAIILLPPDQMSLWFHSGRAQFVSFKYHPPHAMGEWLNRLEMLNGGKEFAQSGFLAVAELQENYRLLGSRDLAALRDGFRVRYYVTTSRREDLARAEAFSDPPYTVYDLVRLNGETFEN